MFFQDFLLSLHPPTGRHINRSSWYFPTCFFLVVFASALRSRKSRLFFTLPILILFGQFHRFYAAEPKVDYPLGLWLMWMLLRYVDVSLIGANDRMWKIGTASKEQCGIKDAIYVKECLRDGNLATRIQRSFSLWTNLRGIGWNWEVKHMKVHTGSRLCVVFDFQPSKLTAFPDHS